MKKVLVTIIVLTLNVSCDFNMNTSGGSDADYFDNSLIISYRNNIGDDLLNPNNAVHYKEDSMKLFYDENGVLKEVNLPNTDNPKQFRVVSTSIDYRLLLNANFRLTSGNTITYLQLSNTDMDTIVCEFVAGGKKENYSFIKNVWYNDEHVYLSGEVNDSGYFVIEK